jgi:hypothetical protein
LIISIATPAPKRGVVLISGGEKWHDCKRRLVRDMACPRGGAVCWDEHVALAAYGAQNPTLFIADGFPDIRDALRKGVVRNGDVIPNLCDDLVFFDQVARLLGKQPKHGVRAGAKINAFAG